jgi:hypothetical protein
MHGLDHTPHVEEGRRRSRLGGILRQPPQPCENDALLANMLAALEPGQRAGIIHYVLPSPPKGARFVACVAVVCGFNNRGRIYSVFERTT